MKNTTYIFLSTTLLTASACSPVVEEKADLQIPLQRSEPIVQQQLPVSKPSLSEMIETDVVTQQEHRLDFEKKKQQVIRMPSKSMADQAFYRPAPVSGMAALPASIRPSGESVNREKYAHFDDNGIKLARQNPVSTFSIDVDTGAYSNARRMLNDGQLPAKDAVRIEEFINYFSYDDNAVKTDAPFSVFTEVAPTPWNKQSHLMRVSLKAAPITQAQMNQNNLVFLIDVSGSMRSPDKIGLLKKSLKLLVRQLGKDDRITIVVYAGASGLALETVDGSHQLQIEQAIAKLEAGGSTNGGAGIKLAYQTAEQAFIKGGNNRVILATDGDFNVGTVDHHALIDLIEKHRSKGIFLTTLGFGKGNYNDHLMEQLADHGNGNYAYIDTLMEAKKVLIDEMGSTLETVAKDVKIQIEFNPMQIDQYRLIGYENRHLAREDFNNDKVDAGDIGAGHSVMALYEVTLASAPGSIDPLRYLTEPAVTEREDQFSDELAFVKLRYKPVDADNSILNSTPVKKSDIKTTIDSASQDFRFASAVAAYGQLLRGGKYLQDYRYKDIIELAEKSRGQDKHGLRSHFLQMVGLTQTLDMKVSSL